MLLTQFPTHAQSGSLCGQKSRPRRASSSRAVGPPTRSPRRTEGPSQSQGSDDDVSALPLLFRSTVFATALVVNRQPAAARDRVSVGSLPEIVPTANRTESYRPAGFLTVGCASGTLIQTFHRGCSLPDRGSCGSRTSGDLVTLSASRSSGPSATNPLSSSRTPSRLMTDTLPRRRARAAPAGQSDVFSRCRAVHPIPRSRRLPARADGPAGALYSRRSGHTVQASVRTAAGS